MIRREIFGPNEIIEETEASLEEIVSRLQQLQPGEYWSSQFRTGKQSNNPDNLVRYVDRLREAGLDINRGNARFGFRMPLPERRTLSRELQIFRRS